MTTGVIDWVRADAPEPLQHWSGGVAALRAQAERLGVEPTTGSPLADVTARDVRPGGDPMAGRVPLPGFDDALRVLTQPDAVIDLDHVPPGTGASVRLYAGADAPDWVCQWDAGDRQDLWWPIGAATLARFACGLVETTQPVAPLGVSFSGDRAAFEVLVALVDLLQEEALVALLGGRQAPDVAFDARDVLATCTRPRSEHDLRWMVARGHRMAPTPIAPSEGAIADAIERFAREGWLVRDGRRHAPTSLFRLACAVLADTRGWWTIDRRTRGERGDRRSAWRCERAAVLRGPSTLWTCRIDDVTLEGFTFVLRDVGVDDVTRLAGELFVVPASRHPPVVDDAPQTTASRAGACPACGRQLRQGVAFCTQCGTRLT